MRRHRSLVLYGTCCGLAWLSAPGLLSAQPLLEKLEQNVQTQPAPAPLPVPGANPLPAPPAGTNPAPAANPAPAVEPGYLGIVADDVTNPAPGLQLMEILPGGPAQAAGLQPGDYITSIDGKDADSLAEMAGILSGHPAGDSVTFIIRRGQQVMRADVTLGKRPPPDQRKYENFGPVNDPNAPVAEKPTIVAAPKPAPPPVDPKMIPPEPPKDPPPPGPRIIPHPGDYATPTLGPQPTPPLRADVAVIGDAGLPPPLLGVRAVPVTPEMQVSLNLPEPRGALVVDIRPNSPAHHVGIPLEAVIVAVDGKRIDTPQQLSETLQTRGLGATVRISYFRYGQLSERSVKLGEGGPPPVAPPDAPPAELPGSASPAEPTPAPSETPKPATIPPVPAPPTPLPPLLPTPPVSPSPPVGAKAPLPPETPASPTKVTPPLAPTAPTPPLSPAAPTPPFSPAAPIATPLPPTSPENETELLRLRVKELEKKLAEAEALLKEKEKQK